MQRSYGQKTVSPTLRCLFGVLKPIKNTLYEVLEVLLEVLEVVLEVLEVLDGFWTSSFFVFQKQTSITDDHPPDP